MIEISKIFKNKSSTIDDIINILTKVFNYDNDKFIGRVLRARCFLDSRFYNFYSGINANKLPFYTDIEPYIGQWSLLFQLWNEINRELNSHHDFLNNLTAKELIYNLGAYAEILNAQNKVNEKSPEFIRQQETDRLGYYASLTEITINKILTDYLPLKDKSVKNDREKIFNYDEINSIVNTYNKFDLINNVINQHIFQNSQVYIDGKGIIKVSLADKEADNNLFVQKKSLFKLKCDYQYRQNFVHTLLKLEHIPKYNYEMFEGYDPVNNSINIKTKNIKELCNEKSLYYQSEYLTELMLLSNYNLTEGNYKNVIIELKDETILNLSELLKVGLIFKFISKLYVYQIDKEFENKNNYYFKKLQEENPLYRAHNNAMNFLTKIDKNAEHDYLNKINKGNEQQKVEKLIIETKEKIFNSIDIDKTIVSFNKEELIHLIAERLKIKKETVNFFISLLTSKISNIKLIFQPILSINETLYWYPNLFAFTSMSELIYESLLETKQIELHQIQTQITENFLSERLKNAGFKIIHKDNDREFIDFDGKNGDLDAVAYKNGTLLHFELKQSHIRNDPEKIISLRNTFIKKGEEQIPRIQKYLRKSANKEQFINGKKRKNIREKLQLEEHEEIIHVKSYLISNNFDFDRQEFNGFRKISILELIVLLTDTEIFLHDFDDYLKINIRRIKKSGKATPEIYLRWANGEISNEEFVQNEENVIMAHRFVESFKKPYWKDENDKMIEELIDNIENNRVFDYLDELIPKIKIKDIPIGKYTLQVSVGSIE